MLRNGVDEDGSFRCKFCLRHYEDYYYYVDDSSQDNWMGRPDTPPENRVRRPEIPRLDILAIINSSFS